MLKSDVDDLISFMEKQWPDKYTPEELASWARELQPWDLDEVRAACIQHKQNKRFKPFLREVKDILRELYPLKSTPVERQASRFRTIIAQQWAESHPERKDEHEAWLIMRYYRYWFCRVKKSITDVADARKALDKPPFPEDTERLNCLERACVSGCKGDLIAAGLGRDLAESAATWINSHDPEFESYLDDLAAELGRAAA